MNPNNRRYIGNKYNLKDWIFSEIENSLNQNNDINKNFKFIDAFSGTGSVGLKFADENYDVVLNDNLYHNFLIYNAFTGIDKINMPKMEQLLENYNNYDYAEGNNNHFSNLFGNKYFSLENSYIIWEIRKDIEELYSDSKINFYEYSYLISALLLATDKVANTVGHYESFLKRSETSSIKKINLKHLSLKTYYVNFQIFNMDINQLIQEQKFDYNSILYLDPPYNARQYINFYHVLEYISIGKESEIFEGNSMKFKRDHLKSEYSRSKAIYYFEELVNYSSSKYIILSYNNTYNARSTASNNKMSEKDILKILNKIGKVSIVEKDYAFFNSGKTKLNDHKERLYICVRY
ncbi:DNA adenine methylase [Spiroplasma culicicola]|uniref:site-specific DNA-methyltransferase (adenine-specific) n=1 Tax=Spiroplasma culicicola AES-1 TaxID=1276246 RepID=W6A6Z6_9MOLU|nr:DNA adenine methylase [Spiroplasma culicicola]AHI52757.1 adenine-specific DNA methylase [Spiroplasma culicicola AES-1]